jgi:hypothetical protein
VGAAQRLEVALQIADQVAREADRLSSPQTGKTGDLHGRARVLAGLIHQLAQALREAIAAVQDTKGSS